MSYPKLTQSEINHLSKFTYQPVAAVQQPAPVVLSSPQVLDASHQALLEMGEQCEVAAQSPAFLNEYKKSEKLVEKSASALRISSIIVGLVSAYLVVNTVLTFGSNTSSLLKFGANKFNADVQKSMVQFKDIVDPKKLEASGMADLINVEEVAKKLFDDSGAVNFNAMGSLVSVAIWGLFIAKAKQGLTAVADSSSVKGSYSNFITLFALLALATLTKFATEGAPNAVLLASQKPDAKYDELLKVMGNLVTSKDGLKAF
jgi:hypothetical protein